MINLNLKPKVKRLMEQFLVECKKQGLNIIITQGVRTIAEQNALYAKGRTVLPIGKQFIVTNCPGGYSNHNFGCAFDIGGISNGKLTYNIDWNKIEQIAAKVGLSWGGLWNNRGKTGFVDKPHLEYTAGYTTNDFRNQKVDETKFI